MPQSWSPDTGPASSTGPARPPRTGHFANDHCAACSAERWWGAGQTLGVAAAMAGKITRCSARAGAGIRARAAAVAGAVVLLVAVVPPWPRASAAPAPPDTRPTVALTFDDG